MKRQWPLFLLLSLCMLSFRLHEAAPRDSITSGLAQSSLKMNADKLPTKNTQAAGKPMLAYDLAAMALIFLISLLIYRQQQITFRRAQKRFRLRQLEAEEQLEKSRINEDRLRQELALKQQALAAQTLNVIQKKQLLNELKDKIDAIRKDADNALTLKLNSLQTSIKHDIKLEESWDEFTDHFQNTNDSFFKMLIANFPCLSHNELRLCALLKLNFSTKEMAAILGISPDSVKMARYRLRKKLGLGHQNDLALFLIQLDQGQHEKLIN